MMHSWFGGHSRLLLRTYIVLLLGVMVVAVLLELALGYLATRHEPEIDPWVSATLKSIETQLAAASPEAQQQLLTTLTNDIGTSVRLLDSDDIEDRSGSTPRTHRLRDADGRLTYLHRSEQLDRTLYLGPVSDSDATGWYRFAAPTFYFSVFVLVGLWLRPVLRDIDVISAAATRFSADYRQPTDAAASTTELTSLAQQVDRMSARLSGMIQNQKELIAALSHEMRTPLARVRFALAILEEDTSHQAERVEAIKTDLQEVDALVGTMLEYARLDHPDLQMHRQSVPTDTFVAAVVTSGRGDDKTVTVDTHGVASLDIDMRLMTLAASNLLSNALRHAHTHVALRLLADRGRQSLIVEDDGAGIAAADRDTVFKAFTRLDDSRTRGTGGYGLGLAIVARIAELHGGEARVDQSPDLGGARFEVCWSPQKAAGSGRGQLPGD